VRNLGGVSWTERGARVVCAALIALVAWGLPGARKDFIRAVTRHDAPPGPPPPLAKAPDDAAGLPPAAFTRVVLIDGVNREDALAMSQWSALCARGLDLEVDVGFPTVSLPVQVALWSGLTQQQSGILYHSGFVLDDPLGRRGIPAQVEGSVAVAETHPYIVQSLGFTTALPISADGKTLPEGWDTRWLEDARLAVTGPAPLAFVHVLRVDTAGHQKGRRSGEWTAAIATSDTILGDLVAAGDAAHPDTRWFVLADHGHLPGGGHASEERAIRRVRACIAGAGVAPGTGGPIAVVDLSRAIADSVGVLLPKAAAGRPLSAALAAPLGGDELVPGVPRGRAIFAGLLLVLGALVTAAALGRRAALWGPWWWVVAIVAMLVALGPPSLSTPFIYKAQGDTIAGAARAGIYLAVIWVAAAVLLADRPAWRVALASVALPLAGMCAALVLCGGLPFLWGDTASAPIAPRWTAWASVLMVITARALWAVALALLATAFLPASDRVVPRGTRRSGS
jgi:hypothetical protein